MKKVKVAFSRIFQKPTLEESVRIKRPGIKKAKTEPQLIIALIMLFKNNEIYVLGIKCFIN